ncbi:MAG: hypothetical protein AAGE84_04700 [Cyanobacteria bacterium P01_G01_bin.39]
MSLSSDEKKLIIKQLKEHTDVAEYAFKDALKKQTLSEDELLFLLDNIKIISVLRPVIKANRDIRRNDSRKNNDKLRNETNSANIKVKELEQENTTLKQKIDNLLQELLDIDNSEIYRLGQWLKNSLSKTGTERDQGLIEKDLVHKEFYNTTVEEAEAESNRRDKEDKQIEAEYLVKIKSFEERVDYLREINKKSKKFIKDNHGDDTWNDLIK